MKLSTKIILSTLCVFISIGLVFVAVTHIYYPRYLLNQKEFDVTQTPINNGDVTVMSFNIRRSNILEFGKRNWFYRADLVMQVIEKNAPDVIGFQEVKELQYEYLSKNLKGYDSITEYRDDSSDPESCPIFYRSDKYSLVNSGHFWLSETPELMSKGWDGGCYRLCSYVMLFEKATGNQFAVFNTHLDNAGQEAKIKGAQLILEKTAIYENLPKILVGDMNSLEASDVYKKLSESFIDVEFLAPDSIRSNTANSWGAEESIIDYIMYSKFSGFTANKYWVENETFDGVYASDHYAVCANLSFNSNPA